VVSWQNTVHANIVVTLKVAMTFTGVGMAMFIVFLAVQMFFGVPNALSAVKARNELLGKLRINTKAI
jgi:hypothetical protein